jgi:hypothetical protein
VLKQLKQKEAARDIGLKRALSTPVGVGLLVGEGGAMKRLLGTAIVALFGLTMAALSAGIECDDAEMIERSGQVAEAGMLPLPASDASGKPLAS